MACLRLVGSWKPLPINGVSESEDDWLPRVRGLVGEVIDEREAGPE